MKVRVAVVQDCPKLLDLEGTLDKIEILTKEAVNENAELVLFPEAFISAYPRGLDTSPGKAREVWLKYCKSSILVPGKETNRLGKVAKSFSIYLIIGVIEINPLSQGTLYCTLLYFGPDGSLLGKHRKLKPTEKERVLWGEGDGSTLKVYDTSIGKIGGLICWENYMPLARMTMYSQGVQIYLAPNADYCKAWQNTVKHIAREGRCYVLACNQYVTKDDYPPDVFKFERNPEDDDGESDDSGTLDVVSNGGSVIISPYGDVIAGPLFGGAGILHATLDMDDVVKSKFDFDVVGHYSRKDIFSFSVNNKEQC
ncbi:DgyrCDS14659 [Dimorphilus gyrociliatus]|uniref:DgyrCDS14659 n=1 Tax=Dimorphilus gyrociliatus TaxID=2664684 RepID=A0A7I8WEC5_9ANNE|nr:DgyrCDS14659 [Dimorphilus gyrociliatus]